MQNQGVELCHLVHDRGGPGQAGGGDIPMIDPGGNPFAPDPRAESLMTREQEFKARKWDRMFVSRAVITSKAFLSLRTPAACQVYLLFLSKCVLEEVKIIGKPGKRGRKEYAISNNGKIQFSYREAREKYGISDNRFTVALDELLRVGLIDLTHSSLGLEKDVSLYAISDRWQKFDTPDFVEAERPKRGIRLGFKRGNTYGRNCQGQMLNA